MAKLQCFDPDTLYPPNDAADGLGFTAQTLAKWRCLGGGPEYLKMHGRVFYVGTALNAHQAAAERGGTPAPAARDKPRAASRPYSMTTSRPSSG